MKLTRLLRLDESRQIAASVIGMPDEFVGYDESGAPIVKPGAVLRQMTWEPGYAPLRKRVLRLWLRVFGSYR